MLQGLFLFWDRDAILPPLYSVITQAKKPPYFIPSVNPYPSNSLLSFPLSQHLHFPPEPQLNLPGTQKRIKVNNVLIKKNDAVLIS